LVLALVTRPLAGADYTVKGTLRTSNSDDAPGYNQIVRRIKVFLYDDNQGADDMLGWTYADAGGHFQIQFTRDLGEHPDDPDVYLYVRHNFTAPDSKLVQVMDGAFPYPVVDDYHPGGWWYDIQPGVTDMGTVNLSNNKANIGSHATECLWVLKAVSAGGWTMPHLLGAYVSSEERSWCNGDEIEIASQDYDSPEGWESFSVIHEETAHFVMYNAYGDDWPGAGPVKDHGPRKVTTEASAIIEGWGAFVAQQTALPDRNNTFPIDAAWWWRGRDNDGTNNAGDVVEGAVWRIWHAVDDLNGAFEVLRTDNPEHLREWINGYGSLVGWGTSSADDMFQACQENGVVYTRAELRGFYAAEPADDGPVADANMKVIDEITFLRGEEVIIDDGLSSADDLNLQDTSRLYGPSRRRLLYKEAAPSLDEPTTPEDWTRELQWGAWVGDYAFDTTDLADGDCDLVVQVENEHGWADDLNPDFADNGGQTGINSDERWLKYLKTWYYRFDDPLGHSAPDPEHEEKRGKVIIDNTPPTISSVKPAQNVE
jgi:hypothetical protein